MAAPAMAAPAMAAPAMAAPAMAAPAMAAPAMAAPAMAAPAMAAPAMAAPAMAAPAMAPLPKGPWVQYPRKTAISILWQTRLPVGSHLRYWPSGAEAEAKVVHDLKPRLDHRIDLTGLRPGTRYRYAVQDTVGRWRSGGFQTAVERGDPFTFLVYGDCRSNFERHRAVVEGLLTEGAAFAVNTGDFVEDGAKPKLWYVFFRAEQPLLRRLAVFPVLGNHELKSSWARGVRAFRRNFVVPGDGPYKGVTYSFKYGNSLFLVLDSNRSFVSARQTRWATERLQAASRRPEIRHIFVFLHHSPYASGIHGENADLLVSGLVDTMVSSGVDVVFAGHDHVYERGIQKGLRYVVSGGCGAPLYPRRKIHKYTHWFESTAHYVRVAVEGDEVEVTALRPDGELLDNFRYAKRKGGATPKPRFVTLKDAHPEPLPAPAELTPPHLSLGRPPPHLPVGSVLGALALGLLGLGVLWWVLRGRSHRGGRRELGGRDREES